jgi:uncharacterized protein (DUF2236 family)/predicted MPP superfamily phosphohydrolase
MDASAALERHHVQVRERLRAAGVTRPGPDSVSWKVNREIVVVAGWGRAILLQLAHPLVAAGVADHSTFRSRPMARIERLRSTVGAMLSLTFGDDEEAVSAAARINVIHDRVFGRLHGPAGAFPAGTRYSAHDAELLRWVHATLIDSVLLAYERLIERLSPEERDRYCAEAADMEPLLDIPAGLLPRTMAELTAYLQGSLGKVAVTPRSRALARAALFPPGWRLLWPTIRPVQLMTIGLLPEAVRRAYGFEWTRREERALSRWTTALRSLGRLVPAAVRHWPPSRRNAGPLEIGLDRALHVREERVTTRQDACRLLYLSDIHLRNGRSDAICRQVLDAVNRCRPDAVLLGGDLVDRHSELSTLCRLVGKVGELAPVLAVGGNHDRKIGMHRVREAIVCGGGRWIHDGIAHVTRAGRVVAVSGPETAQRSDGHVRVLCAHDPSIWKRSRDAGYDLVLAGHLHGCQVVAWEHGDRLFPGAIFYPYCFLSHRFGKTRLVVSRGVSDRVPIRWRCPREAVLCHV